MAVVELAQEGAQDLGPLGRLVMAREIGAGAVVAPAAEEVDLDAAVAARLVDRQRVGVADALDIDVLVRLDVGQGADTVAPARRLLEIQPLVVFVDGVAGGDARVA